MMTNYCLLTTWIVIHILFMPINGERKQTWKTHQGVKPFFIREAISNSANKSPVFRRWQVMSPEVNEGRARRAASGSITSEEKQEFLKSHNNYRKMVSPTASNMLYMTWNDDLANMAQKWAEQCAFSHGQPSVSNRPDGWIGQNLYAGTGASSAFAESAVTAWYNEVHDYSYHGGYCSSVCGHYTQVVWADSYEVGCGIAFCGYLTGFTSNAYYTVCNYLPGGNYQGVSPYKSGSKCAACPANFPTCDDGLCVCVVCENGGTIISGCQCECPDGYTGATCSVQVVPTQPGDNGIGDGDNEVGDGDNEVGDGDNGPGDGDNDLDDGDKGHSGGRWIATNASMILMIDLDALLKGI